MSPRAARPRMTRSMSLMIEGYMPSVGSSRTRSRGRVTSARDCQLLLLAAGEVAATPAQHLLQHRKQREDLVRDMAQAARQDGKPGLEILRNGQVRKDLAALRHQRRAGTGALIRR
jgi:hypothetical protein